MTEQVILDRVQALLDENATLKAANADQANKLKRAQERIREIDSRYYRHAYSMGLETSTHQLFDFLIRQFTHSGGQSPLIQIPLKEYMDKRGLKDEKEARRQVNADLETLRNIKLTFTDKKAGYVDTYLFGGEKGIKNSVIYFSLSRTFYAILKGYPIMPMPDALYKLEFSELLGRY